MNNNPRCTPTTHRWVPIGWMPFQDWKVTTERCSVCGGIRKLDRDGKDIVVY